MKYEMKYEVTKSVSKETYQRMKKCLLATFQE